MKPLLRFIASNRNGLLWFLIVVGSLSILWGLRMPGGDLPFLLAGVGLIAIGLLLVVARIVARLVLVLRKRPGAVPVFAGWRIWILCVGALLLLGLVGGNGLPFRWAFAVSRPHLERIIGTYESGQPTKGNLRAGLFPISSVGRIDGGFQFTFRKHEFPWGERGVYYSASGRSLDRPHFYSQERIGEKWFSWHYGGW